ncbi:BTB/POZ domain-containing protein POB1 [Acorus calamus]|uniref:BTB/POZ domain-containing protein POB1 n=1 Tax=Acorus calamus TaxID=4465 RepID=A0AAV9C7C5_ACOCL|nr:BTB/POZ domain-containing protein POB1 [Acorus calamus]
MDIQEDDHISLEFAFNNPQFSDRIFQIEISNGTPVDNQIKSSTTTGPKKRKININQIQAEDEHEVYEKVEYMHANSALLATKSAFFYKLFSNGMHDYFDDTSVRGGTTKDKYEVIQCMKYCVQLLKLPMTKEFALLYYLEVPSSVSTNMEVQKLISASKEHLVAHFSDIEKSYGELVNLSITGLE